jgi:hypothetical protein
MKAFALAVLLAVSLAPAVGIAGTTGVIVGTVTDRRNAPIAGATVTVTSPSQREQTVTDANGHFSFVSLAPNTYAVTISRPGYGTIAYREVAVNADASSSVVVAVQRLYWTIDGLRVRQKTDLVQPRTTADVYVVPATWPFYSFNGTEIYALHFVPGLTFGSGPELSR